MKCLRIAPAMEQVQIAAKRANKKQRNINIRNFKFEAVSKF